MKYLNKTWHVKKNCHLKLKPKITGSFLKPAANKIRNDQNKK